MPRRIYPIAEVSESSKRWTVIVQVVERAHVQICRSPNQKKYRRFLLTDSEGTKVSAVIYGNDINYFYKLLEPYKRYHISNAVVRPQNATYRVGSYQYYWIINNTTLVEPIDETNVPVLPCAFEFTKFADLYKFADTENLQNLQAFVIHAFPAKESNSQSITSRDFVIVNEEKIPMLLTLWNEFEQNDANLIANNIPAGALIIGMRVKVTSFHSLSLTSRVTSCFLLNPPLETEKELRQWYNANRDELKQLLADKAYKDAKRLLPPPKADCIMNIQGALNLFKEFKAGWIKADTKLIPAQTKYWYTACANCQKSVNAEVDWKIKCPFCKEEAEVEARCRIGIMLADDTGVINTVIFGQDAEKLIPYTANELKDADEQGFSLTEELARSIKVNTIICFVRKYDAEYQGQVETKYSIVKSYTMGEIVQHASALTEKNESDVNSALETLEASIVVTEDDEQMFTPSTKAAIENVAESIGLADPSVSSNMKAKRVLSYTDADENDNLINAEDLVKLPTHENKETSPGINTKISPSKKLRGKLKLN